MWLEHRQKLHLCNFLHFSLNTYTYVYIFLLGNGGVGDGAYWGWPTPFALCQCPVFLVFCIEKHFKILRQLSYHGLRLSSFVLPPRPCSSSSYFTSSSSTSRFSSPFFPVRFLCFLIKQKG